MGSNVGRDNEKPTRRVTVSRFALGKFQVTQGQWKALMGSNPSYFKDCGDNCPVEQVGWEVTQQYIQKLNHKTGQRYRLPSEAEWEYAASAGCQSEFNVAGQCKDKIEPSEANFNGNFTYNGSVTGVDRGKTIAVGSFAPNGFGLHDMHGNVFEWVQDVSHSDYHGAPTDGSAWESGGVQPYRVLRGGSWFNSPDYLRAADRSRDTPGDRLYYHGFRLARMLP